MAIIEEEEPADLITAKMKDLQATDRRAKKDPRAMARRYQLMLCDKAKKENVIVCLETGTGKTLIAVLLMLEFADRIKKPGRNVCVFLAPTVNLVQQQAKVIEKHSDFEVGLYFGKAKHSSNARQNWLEELEKHEFEVIRQPPTATNNYPKDSSEAKGFVHPNKILEMFIKACHRKDAVLIGNDKTERQSPEIMMTEKRTLNCKPAEAATAKDPDENNLDFFPKAKNTLAEHEHFQPFLENNTLPTIQNGDSNQNMFSLNSTVQELADEDEHLRSHHYCELANIFSEKSVNICKILHR